MARKNRSPQVDERVDAAGTVSIACRLPAGLEIHVAGHGVLKIKGANDRLAIALDRYHGVTSGVPADVWEAVKEQYATAKWLTEGHIFATTKSKDAVRESESIGEQNAGFNPMDPDNLPGGLEQVK